MEGGEYAEGAGESMHGGGEHAEGKYSRESWQGEPPPLSSENGWCFVKNCSDLPTTALSPGILNRS